MNKELEYVINYMTKRYPNKSFNELYEYSLDFSRAYDKALTSPTADDVVKALNKGSVVEHKYSNGLFYYKSIIDEKWYIIPLDSLFNEPHLITIIGRFYEGKSERE